MPGNAPSLSFSGKSGLQCLRPEAEVLLSSQDLNALLVESAAGHNKAKLSLTRWFGLVDLMAGVWRESSDHLSRFTRSHSPVLMYGDKTTVFGNISPRASASSRLSSLYVFPWLTPGRPDFQPIFASPVSSATTARILSTPH